MLIVEAVLIAEDTGVLLICNPLQSQDVSIQTDVSESRVVSGNLPNLDSPDVSMSLATLVQTFLGLY